MAALLVFDNRWLDDTVKYKELVAVFQISAPSFSALYDPE